MIKEVELNQFGEAGGMQPNEPTQTDLCDDGGMKAKMNAIDMFDTSGDGVEIKTKDINEDAVEIKLNKPDQPDFCGDGDVINVSKEFLQTGVPRKCGVTKVRFYTSLLII